MSRHFGYINHYAMKRARLAVLQAAGYRCSVCNEPAAYIHHKDGSLDNHALDNLMAVCAKCHMQFHLRSRGQLVWSAHLLRAALMHRGLSVSSLASATGITRNTIYRALGSGRVSTRNMKRIAEILDYPLEFFIAEASVSVVTLPVVGGAVGESPDPGLTERQMAYRKISEAIGARVAELGGNQRLLKYWLAKDLREHFAVRHYWAVALSNLDRALELVRRWTPGCRFGTQSPSPVPPVPPIADRKRGEQV